MNNLYLPSRTKYFKSLRGIDEILCTLLSSNINNIANENENEKKEKLSYKISN